MTHITTSAPKGESESVGCPSSARGVLAVHRVIVRRSKGSRRPSSTRSIRPDSSINALKIITIEPRVSVSYSSKRKDSINESSSSCTDVGFAGDCARTTKAVIYVKWPIASD